MFRAADDSDNIFLQTAGNHLPYYWPQLKKRSLPGIPVSAHAQGFRAHDKLLLPTLRAFILWLVNIQVPINLHALLKMCSHNDSFKITLQWWGKLGVRKVSWYFKIRVFTRNFLVTTVIRIFNYICSTSSSDMHFCLEYDHKCTKQYTVHLLTTQNAGLFGLYVVEQSVTCTNSSPVVPCTLPDMPATLQGSSRQLGIVQAVTSQL